MSDELRELYQDVILDHSKKPRNFGDLDGADHRADGYNPLCGDRIQIQMRLDGDEIADVHFTGSGCAICTASASMMTESLKGMSRAEAETLFDGFRDLATGDVEVDALGSALGKLVVFAGVREFPIRVKCATLPWHTMKAALEDRAEAVTTE